MKKILFVSGTRADFGKLEPLADAAIEEGCEVVFFVTGMHMFRKYGLTKLEVHRHFGSVVEFINQNSEDPLEVILSKTIIGFSDYVQELEPDAVVIHGDRVEALACSIVCATKYIPCVHVEGGEVSGTIDETFRHCNTKLSNVHLVSSVQAKRRVMMMGETEGSIHVIGSPELDIHMKPSGVEIDEVKKRYDIAFDDYGICVFHSVTSETQTIGAQARALFQSLKASGKPFVVISPNNDPGSEGIFAEIERLPSKQFRVIPSMRFRHFSELMKNASLFTGNSSTGVREAPFLGIPSLNIGTRQSNRAISDRVVSCAADDSEAIQNFISMNWENTFKRHTGFGSGCAAEKFSTLLKSGAFWNLPLQKRFADPKF